MAITKLALPKRNETLREQLVDTLRQAVLGGQIQPGEKVVEAQLAEQLGVSRGPVREAIRQLIEEGLIEQTPYKGSVVRTLSVRDIEELYSFRTLIESFAFERLWDRRGPEFYEALRTRFDALNAAITAGDQQAAIRSEMDLHGTVYEFLDHGLLLESWRMLRGRLHFYFTLLQTAHGRAGPLHDAHDRYVELASGDDLGAMLAEIDGHMQRGLGTMREFVVGWGR